MFYYEIFYKKLRVERIFVHKQQIFRPLNVPPYDIKIHDVLRQIFFYKKLRLERIFVHEK